MRFALLPLPIALAICAPDLAQALASPFLTGASSLQTNILAWLTPVASYSPLVIDRPTRRGRRSREP
jgi:hypothetical protein